MIRQGEVYWVDLGAPSGSGPGLLPPHVAREPGPFAGVAIEQSIDKSLDYAIPPKLLPQIKVGQRVRVQLGQ